MTRGMTRAKGSLSMRALVVVHYPIFGGPHNQALRLAEPLHRRGWNTLVVIPDEPGNAAERLREGDLPVLQMPFHRVRAIPDPRLQARTALSFPGEVDRIRRTIREHNVDVVLIGGLINPHAAVAARREGVPVVWQLLDTRPPMPLRRAIMPLVTRLADAVMSTGIEVARVHPGAQAFGDRLLPYYPPVDTRAFSPDPARRASARAELGVPEGACLIGTVANLNPQKGHEYLIRAAALVHRTGPDLAVRILGAHTPTQSAYGDAVRAEAAALGLLENGRLSFVDPGSRVAELLPAFDLFLLTSVPRSEGVPTVILEAMACGLPVVATDVGAVREVVEDGVTGFVVPPLDTEAIARATRRLLDDPALRTRMGEVARRRAVERYDVEVCAATHVRAFETAIAHHRRRHGGAMPVPASSTASSNIRDLLLCPACHGSLHWSEAEARCRACARTYPVVDGIPILLLDQSAADHDELEHLHGHPAGHAHGPAHQHGHKQQQAAYFDREQAAEFEIARPHGTPALYRFLLGEKFRRSVGGLAPVLPGATALTVCGGSGMDAEYLARAGARVIASDISLGAAQRAQQRARRYRLPILPVVADVERLPLADRTVDLVYVHDGLHHLERPALGLAEMARVAARAVSVTEPARAGATALAVRAGWALEREEAGNRVARLTPEEIAAPLRAAGLRPVHVDRYAMYYGHEPGPLSAALSRPALFPLTRSGWRLANALIGRWGNKLTLQALRP